MRILLAHPSRLLIGLVLGACIGAGIWYVSRAPDMPTMETDTVKRGTVRYSVDVTGRVEPASRLSLSFGTAGVLEAMHAKEGERVEAGTVLATLERATLAARVHEAQAAVARAEADLAERLRGARAEDVAVGQAKVASARVSRSHALEELRGVMERSWVLADNVLRDDVDPLFANPATNPNFGITVVAGGKKQVLYASPETESALAQARTALGKRFRAWKELPRSEESSGLLAEAREVEEHLSVFQDFLTMLGRALAERTAGDGSAESAFASYQTALSGGRATISSLLSEVRATREAYALAESAYDLAQQELLLREAPATGEVQAQARAALAAALAGQEAAQAEFEKTTLPAPLAGMVAEVRMEVGEYVTPSEAVVLLDALGESEIVAYVPEADVAGLSVGALARATFDAFDRREKFELVIARISASETMREGVATYKTVLVLTRPDARLLPGLTADITVFAKERQEVLYVPTRAIMEEAGRTFVRLPEEGRVIPRDVVAGLRGSEGFTEIVSGLREGEEVVVRFEE